MAGGNPAGAMIAEAKGGAGPVFDVETIGWMPVMPANGMSFGAAPAAAKSRYSVR